MADITYESQTAAIAKWQAALRAKAAEVDAKFMNRVFYAGEMAEEISRTFVIAGDMLETVKTMSSPTPLQVKKIEDIVLELGELRGFFNAVAAGRLASSYPPMWQFKPGDAFHTKAREAQKQPILWLIGVGTPVLQTQRDMDEMLERASNIPSAGLKWTLEQILKALGLPEWALPAIGVTALVGVGAWAYFAFLAPIGSAARLARR